jgi:hypothetical protein
MVFCDDVVLLLRGFGKTGRATEIPYLKIDYVTLALLARTSSFVIKADDSIRRNGITYTISRNLTKPGEKAAFVKFLNHRGVSVVSNNSNYLYELFGSGYDVREWDYHGYLTKMYYVPGVGKE